MAAVVVIGLLSLIAITLAVVTIADLREPVIWGTFHQEGCEPKPFPSRSISCTPYGEWKSDDGSIVKERIVLDGFPDEDGSARTSFRPTGILHDDGNEIVHVEATTALGPWFVVAFSAGIFVWWLWRVQIWRVSRSGWIRPRHHSTSLATESVEPPPSAT